MRAIRLLLLMLIPAIIVGCSSDDDGLTPDPGGQPVGQIKFEIGIAGQDNPILKAATDKDFKTVWETGDEIGLFIVKGSGGILASGNHVDNMKLTLQSNGTWQAASAIYYPNDGDNLDFYAYYPYDAGMTDPTAYTFSVQANQSAVANYSKSDLLLAKAENIAKSSSAVQLTFSHSLSLVQIEVKREVNMPHFDADNFTVTLTGALTDAALGWSGNLAGTGTPTDMVMHRVADASAYIYRALIPAQTLPADSKVTFVQTTTGKEIDMEYRGVASKVLAAADAQKYSVTLGWGIDPAHTYAVGDEYPNVGPAVGVVFEISDGGIHGKVVGLQETQSYWGPGIDEEAAGVVGIRSETDGKTGTRNLIIKRKDDPNFNTDYLGFNWIYRDMNNGDTEGVWYLPASNELVALYNARSAVDATLTSISGELLSNHDYWSSTESSRGGLIIVSNVSFQTGHPTISTKNNVKRFRCILAF